MSPSVPTKLSFTKVNRKRKNEQKMNTATSKATALVDSSENEFSKTYLTHVNDSRRAHHNELERKRRDHIKDHFLALKDAIPTSEGGKVLSSRASILKRALEYITTMKKRISKNQDDIVELRLKNEQLEAQVRMLEQQELPTSANVEATNVRPASTPIVLVPKQQNTNEGSIIPRPSTVSHTSASDLLPNLTVPPASMATTTTTTVTNVFPLVCSTTNPTHQKITAFTPTTTSTLLSPSGQYGDHLFQTIFGQLMQPNYLKYQSI